ncbi:exonuclease 1 [Spodoptera litura]|uniref:Exonuclease 1 n=1 Tax=Spodoptera litura TaxID=69820 RepID=A0A9J7IXA3_SPOLT|nr:exonuclease 1 [Spodoptera litura]
MGITGLLPFIDKASRRTNISEFSGCTVAIDSYCWLHKGTYSCADKLIRGEQTDMHIRYCMKYVTMLLSHNIKPILVFDGRHLPAKAMTESKRRESRDISKKRAAELLSLGQTEEARKFMRRGVDITHSMALSLIQECRKHNVDCIVAPYEADAQLAYLNIKNIAHIVITEDSDLILFGCTKVFFKMDPEGMGTLVDTTKLPLAMKCPIERYSFEKFRQMCIMSGCDYLASLPGIGLAKARQFVIATQDPNFANALKKLPSFLKKSSLVVSDEYRESFMKAEATFKHQYVYDPLERKMVRLTEPDDEEIEQAFCVNAGELLDPKTAFELALGNLDPFTLKKMDDWHPDYSINKNAPVKTNNWKEKGVSSHPSIWSKEFLLYLDESYPWRKKEKKPESILPGVISRPRKVVNLVSKYVPETQDESLSIETLSNMYCMEPAAKKPKIDCDNELSETFTQCTEDEHNRPINEDNSPDQFSTRDNKSPILENKERSFKKLLKTGQHSVLKKLSRFPRTVLDNNVVESKFFSTNEEGSTNEVDVSKESITIEESPEHSSRNPFKKRAKMSDEDSQKENFECNSSPVRPNSPILEPSPKCRRNLITDIVMEEQVVDNMASEDSVIDNTYPMETLITPTASQSSFGASQKSTWLTSQSQPMFGSQSNKQRNLNGFKKTAPKANGVKKSPPLPSNQPTLLSKFGFQKK